MPPRSERSMLMASNQVANIRHQSGAELKNNLPAGFGPINPNWPQRTSKLGKKTDEEWRATRAPYFAEDFDWTISTKRRPINNSTAT